MRCLIFVLQPFSCAVYLRCCCVVLVNQQDPKPCFWRCAEGSPVPAESCSSDMHVICPFSLHYCLNFLLVCLFIFFRTVCVEFLYFIIDISGAGYSANIFIALCTVLILHLHKSCDGKYSSGSGNMQFHGLFLWCSTQRAVQSLAQVILCLIIVFHLFSTLKNMQMTSWY